MYSQDGMGLGHLRRSSNVAHEVLARDARCDILILADSPATSLVASRPGIDVVKLPTIVKIGSASWKSLAWKNGSLASRLERVIHLRARLISETFKQFAPDTVLVDHMPVGALGELKPMLRRALQRLQPPRIFLGLRDILDSPDVIRRVWTKLGAYEQLHDYDGVLVYGCRAIFDATTSYGLLPSARKVVYCNYVTPRWQHQPIARPTSAPFLLMMGGGGRDAFPLATAFLEAAPALCRKLGMEAVVLTGPNMRPADRSALMARATAPVVVRDGFEDAGGWIRNAAAVITLGGYNSLCEVMRWRRKALVVPRAGPSAEQQTRARLFAERGLVRSLDPRALSPRRLAREVVELLDDGRVPDEARLPPLDGAERAASWLLEGAPIRAGDAPPTGLVASWRAASRP